MRFKKVNRGRQTRKQASMSSSASSYSDDFMQTSDSSIDSFDNERLSTAAYVHEPEYTARAKKIFQTLVIAKMKLIAMLNLILAEWKTFTGAKCKNHCTIEQTLRECKCCKEFDNLLSFKLTNSESINHSMKSSKLCAWIKLKHHMFFIVAGIIISSSQE